jgi:hypothetical protein
MNHIKTLFFSFLISTSVSAQSPRLLITTDISGDADDQQSLVRLKVYTNEFNIEGISDLL